MKAFLLGQDSSGELAAPQQGPDLLDLVVAQADELVVEEVGGVAVAHVELDAVSQLGVPCGRA